MTRWLAVRPQSSAASGRRVLPGAIACVLLGALVLPGCSDPPEKERQQAEGALEAARAAGADVYAPIEFQDAQASLKKYDDAVAQRDYRLALNDALEARDRAYEAVKQAGDKKAELRSQTDRLVARAPDPGHDGGHAAPESGRPSGGAGRRAPPYIARRRQEGFARSALTIGEAGLSGGARRPHAGRRGPAPRTARFRTRTGATQEVAPRQAGSFCSVTATRRWR